VGGVDERAKLVVHHERIGASRVDVGCEARLDRGAIRACGAADDSRRG
jgi:hypothetical protein